MAFSRAWGTAQEVGRPSNNPLQADWNPAQFLETLGVPSPFSRSGRVFYGFQRLSAGALDGWFQPSSTACEPETILAFYTLKVIEHIMPTVKHIPGPYRFFFFSFDCQEPKPVHVRRERMVCKFWLEPLTLSTNHGFSSHELIQIRALIRAHLPTIVEAWDAHCGAD